MRTLIMPILILGAFTLMIVLFLIYNKTRKIKQQVVKNISNLKRSSANMDFSIKTIKKPSENNQLNQYLNSINAKITETEKGNIIAYINKPFKVQMKGFANTNTQDLAIRITFAFDYNNTKIMMDDNYGLQKFKGKVLSDFITKHNTCFEQHYINIKKTLK